MTRTETIEPSKGTWDLTALQEELDKVDRYRDERDKARLHIEELEAQLSRLEKENFDYKYKVKAYESGHQPDMYLRRALENISDLKAENRQLREGKDCIASRTRSKTRAAASAGKAPAETPRSWSTNGIKLWRQQKDEETRSSNAMTRHTTKFWMVGAKTELTARRRAAAPHN